MVKQGKVTFRKNKEFGGGGAGASGGAIYGLGFIGALIYFISNAGGFWEGVLGVLQSIIWPVLLIYKAFESIW